MSDKTKSHASKGVLEENISSLVGHRKRAEKGVSTKEKLIAAIGRTTGSLYFIVLNVLWVAGWIVINLGWTPIHPFDPNWSCLANVTSIGSLFLSMLVLVSQNRMAELDEKRAQLNLQISLLAEHETTRLLVLVNGIAKKMKLDGADDPELEELQKLISPDQVLRRIEDENRAHEHKER